MLTVDFSRFVLTPGQKCIDVGCWEGRHMVRICKEPHTICLTGDLNPDNLDRTRKKLLFHQKFGDIACENFFFASMDVTCLPFTENTFDRVIYSEVLEHIPDDDKAVSELVRILKPGGMLAVSVPSFFPGKICWILSRSYANAKGWHIRIYTKKSYGQTFRVWADLCGIPQGPRSSLSLLVDEMPSGTGQ